MASGAARRVQEQQMANVSRLQTATSAARAKRARRWTFLTNHAVVLHLVDEESDLRVVDLAARAGLTERAVQMILLDLVEAGYVRRSRSGRRTTYALDRGSPLRHPVVAGRATVGDLLAALRSEQGEHGPSRCRGEA